MNHASIGVPSGHNCGAGLGFLAEIDKTVKQAIIKIKKRFIQKSKKIKLFSPKCPKIIQKFFRSTTANNKQQLQRTISILLDEDIAEGGRFGGADEHGYADRLGCQLVEVLIACSATNDIECPKGFGHE